MRSVLDPNVIISATLSPGGPPARAFRLWLEGGYELVCSPHLLDELTRALAYSKLSKFINTDEAGELIGLLRRGAVMVDDPADPPEIAPPDPDDDYLIVLAGKSRSVLVSGDRDLLGLSDQMPVYSPDQLLDLVERHS